MAAADIIHAFYIGVDPHVVDKESATDEAQINGLEF